jgi:hypothetical protein
LTAAAPAMLKIKGVSRYYIFVRRVAFVVRKLEPVLAKK